MKLSSIIETASYKLAKEHDKIIQQALRKFGIDIPEDIDPSKFDYTPIMKRVRQKINGEYTKWYVDDQLAVIFSGYTFDMEDDKYVGSMKYKIFEPVKG